MGIQFGGLASGLDTNAIITALLAVESRPIRLLEDQRSQNQEKLSQVGMLEGLVKALEDKAQELTRLDGLFSYSVTPADETIAAFDVTGALTPGEHTLNVLQLASAARYNFLPDTNVTDPSEQQFGAGDITFNYDGTDYTVSVAAGSSLDDVAAAINSQAGEAVTASVVNVGASSSPNYQLVVAGDDTGADFDLVGLAADASIGIGTAPAALTSARNAQVVVDGLTVERSTNLFADVLPGVSFTARAEGQTVFTGDLDVEETRATIEEFVDAFNAVRRFVVDQSSYSEESGPGGVLFGDSILRSVSSALGTALFTPDISAVQADTEGYTTLGLIGIELQSDGTLQIDEEQLDEKLTGNPEAFEAFFTDPNEGILVKLDDALDGLLDGPTLSSGETLDSLFSGRRNAISSVIDSIDTQIERLEFNLERLEESLVQRFANLESLLGGLTTQSAFLSANLAPPS